MSRAFTVLALFLLIADYAMAAEPFGGPGAHFFVTREYQSTDGSVTDQCSESGVVLPIGATSIRQTQLVSVQPSLASGEIPQETSRASVGVLTVCYGSGLAGQASTFAYMDLFDGTDVLTVRAFGDCRVLNTASADQQLQACGLSVIPDPSNGLRGGLLTNAGLITADQPAKARNAHVWTLYVIRD